MYSLSCSRMSLFCSCLDEHDLARNALLRLCTCFCIPYRCANVAQIYVSGTIPVSNLSFLPTCFNSFYFIPVTRYVSYTNMWYGRESWWILDKSGTAVTFEQGYLRRRRRVGRCSPCSWFWQLNNNKVAFKSCFRAKFILWFITPSNFHNQLHDACGILILIK